MVKEFIKVKPSGYYFHGKKFNIFQSLINWFKDNFKIKEYQKELKKARSPRTKATNVDPMEYMGIERQKKEEGETWNNIP
mmetsp:Transcript_17932/g.12926  ORF Transcript_17932/g.12926 Transcript_17932/m.12926 type:complete len:80 (+) Transcript_17932:2338-2577(+)